jgi:predicted transglutaminase-like cysteine proteinase
MSCRVVANEAPLQFAALTNETPQPFTLRADKERSGDVPSSLARKWRGAEEAILNDINVAEQCRANEALCSPAIKKLNDLTATARNLPGRAQLGVINRAVNLAITATPDGSDDVWSTPLDTLTSGKGDCEDYAILKIAILRAAGMSADRLRLLVVRDPASPDLHAVAAARLDGRWLILDNRRFTLVDIAYSDYRQLHAMRMQDDQRNVASADGPSGTGASPVLL